MGGLGALEGEIEREERSQRGRWDRMRRRMGETGVMRRNHEQRGGTILGMTR